MASQPAHASGTARRERDLLREIPEQQLIEAMVGNARLDMPGATRIQQAIQASKKKEKKKKGKGGA